MTDDGIVQIHGKDYMTVAQRVKLWHKEIKTNNDPLSITSDVLNHDPVVVKATVKWNHKIFTGISAVSLSSLKVIEKQNPYEVAETSAVGRALGFAGFGLLESIASADEVKHAEQVQQTPGTSAVMENKRTICEKCGEDAVERRGMTKGGKEYHGIFCSSGDKTHTRWLWE